MNNVITPKDQLIMDWQQAKASADNAIALERRLRTQVVDTVFPKETRRVGTNNHDLGRGFTLRAVCSLSYKLDSSNDSAATTAVADEIEELGNEGAFLVDRLIKWKPELSVSEYKKLQERAATEDQFAKKVLALLEPVLTITDASPQVEVVVPKN